MKLDLNIQLHGQHVELLPLESTHADVVLDAARHPDIWRWLPHDPFSKLEHVQTWIADALQQSDQQAFAIKHL